MASSLPQAQTNFSQSTSVNSISFCTFVSRQLSEFTANHTAISAHFSEKKEMISITRSYTEDDWLQVSQVAVFEDVFMLLLFLLFVLPKPLVMLAYFCGLFPKCTEIIFNQFYSSLLKRATMNNCDVWLNLQLNWKDFFWLTGETPTTLAILANEVQQEFEPFHCRQREGSLDFKNQVML